MQTAFLIFNYFARGGVQRDMAAAARALRRRGVGVTIFCARSADPAPDGCRLEVLKVRGLSNHARAVDFERQIQVMPAMREFAAIVGFNRMGGLDLYFAGDDCLRTRWKSPLLNMLPRRKTFLAQEAATVGAGGARVIFSLTARQENDYRRFYNTEPTRFHRLGPGVSERFAAIDRTPAGRRAARAVFAVAADRLMLVQAAASFHTKGVDRVLDILAKMPKTLLDKLVYVVAGGDRNLEQYRRTAAQRRLPVRFLGGCDRIPELLAGADLMIHPARGEATGGVLAEALCAGLPVMTTELCGYADWVKQYRGGMVLSEPYDEAVWRGELTVWLGDPARSAACRANLAEVWRDKFWYGRDEAIANAVLDFARAQPGGFGA